MKQIKAKLSVIGVTKNKLYYVYNENVKYYKVILDNGQFAIRHKFLFELD